MSVSLSCYMQRTKPVWSGKMTQAANPRKTNSDISEDKPRRDCAGWKTIDGTERQMKCKSMQTQTTLNSSLELWRLSTGPHDLDSHPLLSADGSTLIKDQEALREWWAEHFTILLNRPSSVSATALDQIPQQPTLDELDHLPSVIEIMKAIHQINSDQVSGKDGIPAELYKAAGPEAIFVFHDISSCIWGQEKILEDF